MVLTATETGIDDTVTLEGASLMNSALNSQDSILPATQIPISVKKEVSHIKNACNLLADFSASVSLFYEGKVSKSK